ncbi:MAG: hypothetical protein QMB55_05390 [Propionivibrio sp.]
MAYTVTIKIAGKGTLTSEGSSSFGHMWISLSDGSGGAPLSYGFGPVKDDKWWNNALGPGQRYKNDDEYYKATDFSQTIEISKEQYDAMKSFGENPFGPEFSNVYNGLSNSCIDFVWKALAVGGLNPTGYDGSVWPTMNGIDLNSILLRSRGLFRDLTDGYVLHQNSIFRRTNINTAYLNSRRTASPLGGVPGSGVTA